MSIVVIFALRHALNSARKDANIENDEFYHLGAPTTTEHIFLAANNRHNQYLLQWTDNSMNKLFCFLLTLKIFSVKAKKIFYLNFLPLFLWTFLNSLPTLAAIVESNRWSAWTRKRFSIMCKPLKSLKLIVRLAFCGSKTCRMRNCMLETYIGRVKDESFLTSIMKMWQKIK